MKPHRGTLILVLGILTFLLCGIFTAVPACIMGNNDLKEMDAGRMDPGGRSLTNVGRILGMIGTILTILGFILFLVLVLTGAAAGLLGAGRQ
jgi:hypothetical protein